MLKNSSGESSKKLCKAYHKDHKVSKKKLCDFVPLWLIFGSKKVSEKSGSLPPRHKASHLPWRAVPGKTPKEKNFVTSRLGGFVVRFSDTL
jgi:hypothetical protein